jgi:hypothetical protein
VHRIRGSPSIPYVRGDLDSSAQLHLMWFIALDVFQAEIPKILPPTIIATPPQVPAWIDLAFYKRVEVRSGQMAARKSYVHRLLTVHVETSDQGAELKHLPCTGTADMLAYWEINCPNEPLNVVTLDY